MSQLPGTKGRRGNHGSTEHQPADDIWVTKDTPQTPKTPIPNLQRRSDASQFALTLNLPYFGGYFVQGVFVWGFLWQRSKLHTLITGMEPTVSKSILTRTGQSTENPSAVASGPAVSLSTAFPIEAAEKPEDDGHGLAAAPRSGV